MSRLAGTGRTRKESSHLRYINQREGEPRKWHGRSTTLDKEREQVEPLLFFPHHLDLRGSK